MRIGMASAWLGVLLATTGRAAEGECEVLGKLPASGLPGGVAWDGEALWVAEFFAPKIHRVDPTTGAVLATIPSPAIFTGGLAWDGEALWCAPEQKGILYRLDPSDGTILSSVHAPTFGQPDPNGSGLAWDGTALWHADYGLRRLVRVDPVDGAQLAVLPSPGPSPMGLGWHQGLLVVADSTSDDLSLVDPADGTVVSVCVAPDADSRGLAIDDAGVAHVAGWKVAGVHQQRMPDFGSWFEVVCEAGPSSMGEPARLVAEGSPSVAARDLTLVLAPVPDDFALLLGSTRFAERPFRGALLCIGRPVRLMGVGRAFAGELAFDLSGARGPCAARFRAGETWYFQATYRDRRAHGARRVGLSDAIALTFEP